MYQRRCGGGFLIDYVAFSTNGVTLRPDGAPMRIYVDGVLKSSIETYVRRATLHSATTGPIELSHLLFQSRQLAILEG